MALAAEALAEYRRETVDEIEAKLTADLAQFREEIGDEMTKARAIANAEVTPLPLRRRDVRDDSAPPVTKRA
jgi:hypothetical protein